VTREHLDSEEREIFPVADRMFTLGEQAELARSYEKMVQREVGLEFRDVVLSGLDRLEGLVLP